MRRIHAPRKRADGLALADRLLDALDGGIDEVPRSPGGLGGANVEGKIAQNVFAKLSVMHFGVELHPPHLLPWILNGGDRVGGTGG